MKERKESLRNVEKKAKGERNNKTKKIEEKKERKR